MESPININTATMDELKQIPGIGDSRAKKIIKNRQEKGSLTLEDLKLMPEVPNTMWDPLIENGVIVVEPTEQKETEKVDTAQGQTINKDKLEEMANTILNLQHEFSQLKHEKAMMQTEFEHKINEATLGYKVKMKNREHEYDKQQEEFTRRHKEEIEKILKESTDREEKLLHMIDDLKTKSIKSEPLFATKTGDKSALGAVVANVSTDADKESKEQTRSLLEEYKEKRQSKMYNSQGQSWNKLAGPLPPKMSTYDGKSDWRPYFVQFNHIANRYNWSSQERLDKLLECLRDRALKFYYQKPKSVQDDFHATCKKMEERFGCKDLPNVIRRQLQELRQTQDESLEEYAERTQDLAADGFPGTPENFIQIVATDAFLKGCLDKKAALTAMDKDPENLDKALQYVKSALTNQRVILGLKKPDLKRVTFQEPVTEVYDSDVESQCQPTVRAMYRKGSIEADLNKFDARLKKTEDDLEETKANVQQILGILQASNKPNIQRSPQRQESPKRSPVRNGKCFNCGEEGHFSVECTKPRSRSPQRYGQRSRSPSPDIQRSPLNFVGLKR